MELLSSPSNDEQDPWKGKRLYRFAKSFVPNELGTNDLANLSADQAGEHDHF